MVGFAASPCSRNCQTTLQLPPAATLVDNPLPLPSRIFKWARCLQILHPMLPLPLLSQNSPTLFPAVIKPVSHSSMLFLRECEGFSGYKLYLAEVKVHITQSVRQRMKSLNSPWTFPELTLLLSILPPDTSSPLFSLRKGVLFWLGLKSLPPPQTEIFLIATRTPELAGI